MIWHEQAHASGSEVGVCECSSHRSDELLTVFLAFFAFENNVRLRNDICVGFRASGTSAMGRKWTTSGCVNQDAA